MSEVYIDDTDTSVTYSGVWGALTSSQGFYNQTAHYSNSPSSKATLVFTGTGVKLYGTAYSNQTSYIIDGGTSTYPDSANHSSGLSDALVYSSPTLSNGQHNLTISAVYLTIDYFLVNTTSNIVSTSGNTSTPSSSFISVTPTTNTSSTSISTSITSGSSTSVRSSVSSSDPQAHVTLNGYLKATIWAVIGLAVVAFVSLFCFWLRRRHKKMEKESETSWQTFDAIDGPPLLPVRQMKTLRENPPQVIEQLTSPVNRPMSEPPPYEEAETGHPASTSVGVSQHPARSVRSKSGG